MAALSRVAVLRDRPLGGWGREGQVKLSRRAASRCRTTPLRWHDRHRDDRWEKRLADRGIS